MKASLRSCLALSCALATAACSSDSRPPVDSDAAVIIPGSDGAVPTDNGCRQTWCTATGVCADLNTDPRNCGRCGVSCAALPNVDPDRVSCERGVCVVAGGCAVGWASCDDRDDNGCETDLNDPSHCGACATACAEPRPYCQREGQPVPPDPDGGVSDAGGIDAAVEDVPNAPARWSCTDRCAAGAQRCGGACVDTRSSASHCGRCDNACAGGANATPSCAMGACALTCNEGFADCDRQSANGCEAQLADSLTHCGMCGRACLTRANAATTCAMGACGFTCNTGFGDCDGDPANGCETNLATSASHCGACMNACPAPPSSTAVCAMGACGFRCEVGRGDCDGDASNGCEVDTFTSLTHCGACMNACPTPANASPSCVLGGCAARCDTGFGDCDANRATGCEVDLRVTTAHCGACGNRCPTPIGGRVSCAAGTCVPECDPGYALVGDTCLTTPPRALRPLSTAMVTTRRPTLAWTDAARFSQVRVEVCRDRDCAAVLATADVSTSSWRPPSDLTVRVAFWRVRGLVSGRVASTPSPTWMFVVRARPGARDLAWGARPDFNADGRADLAAGSRGQGVSVFLGSASVVAPAPSQTLAVPSGAMGFGATLAYAGDVNGDGFGDLAVGAAGSGQVFVFHGSVIGFRATPDATLTGMTGRSFGASLAGVGDIDHDGYADLLVAEPGPARELSPRVMLYRGGPSGVVTAAPAQTLSMPSADPVASWGAAVGSAGDFDGDGNEDVLVGAPSVPQEPPFDAAPNSASLFRSTGSALATPAFARWTQGNTTGFGFPLSQVGDVNGDGLADVAVGATGAGFALVYYGREGAPPTGEDRRLTEGGADFGRSLSTGDLNGDGYDDLVVGVDYAPPARPGLRVLVYYGGASGLPATHSQLVANTAAGFGLAVSSPGDMDGDGVDDLAVGAPDASTLFVYRGGSSGPGGNLTRTYVGPSGTGLGVALSGQ